MTTKSTPSDKVCSLPLHVVHSLPHFWAVLVLHDLVVVVLRCSKRLNQSVAKVSCLEGADRCFLETICFDIVCVHDALHAILFRSKLNAMLCPLAMALHVTVAII